jgi:hypothetical protein
MTTRKHKLDFPPLECPTERLQLVPVTVEHKPSARAGRSWQADARLPVTRTLPPRGKITLH